MAPDIFIRPWNLFTTISTYSFCSPPYVYILGKWKEDSHEEILVEKKKIEQFSSQDEWEIRKKIINPYELIFSSLDAKFPGLTTKIPLSRSYFKMIEMLEFSGFWKYASTLSKIEAAHVCEGPGGFIQALLEKSTEKNLEVKSVLAMTLRPIKAHIPGWRRSYHFLKRFPQIQLEYGEDATGNILHIPNQTVFIQKTQKKACIFTADGGFDFSLNYESQEETVFPLLLSSFTIGLSSLQIGGFCIIKLFDMYSDATKDLVCGSGEFFSKWTIYKPATSRPFNSERYFIGIGFLGGAEEWIHHLRDAHGKSIQRLCTHEWPSTLVDCLKEQIKWQENLQSNRMDSSFTLKKSEIQSKLNENISFSKEWCTVFQIPTIPIV